MKTSGGYADNGIGYECFAPNVLNLGVSPVILLDTVAQRFRSSGGVLKEFTSLKGVVISESVGVALDVVSSKKGDDTVAPEPITSRLVLDCMGNASPISAQQVSASLTSLFNAVKRLPLCELLLLRSLLFLRESAMRKSQMEFAL